MRGKWIAVALVIAVGAGASFIWHQKSRSSHAGHDREEKAVYYCPMHPSYQSDKPGTCPICYMKLVRKETSPAAPKELTLKELMGMKPGEVCLLHKCKMGTCMVAMTEEFARLGKCPHCGEDLGVVIKDFAVGGYARLTLSDEKQQIIGVKTVVVMKKPLVKAVRTPGRIAYDPELYQAQQEFLQAQQSHQKAAAGGLAEIAEQSAKLLESTRLKLRLMGLSDEMVAAIEQAGKPDRTLLYSEAGGTVWVYAPVYEYEMPWVKAGQKLEVEAPGDSGKIIEGVIRSIDPVLDPMTRSVRLRAVLQNPEGLLKPEMYVNVTIRLDLGEVLTVPPEAVFSTGERNIVFVAKPGGAFEPREVVLGAKGEGLQEVKSGLAEGEQIVTSGNFLIDSESRLKMALEGMGSSGSSGGHSHGG
ncbi:MAG: efflux RND transporter periplasmic adaptor subunit [Candidatus Omnitrophica bacterium]|nr:efflux RND transporter periplasmic adaptor subunit [Candidatus Omnitrophota bacterium]